MSAAEDRHRDDEFDGAFDAEPDRVEPDSSETDASADEDCADEDCADEGQADDNCADEGQAEDFTVDEDAADFTGGDRAAGEEPGPDAGQLFEELVGAGSAIFERLKEIPGDQLRDLSSDPIAAGVRLGQRLGVEWGASLEDTISFARTRLAGDYAVDQFGFDPEFTERLYLPLVRWVAKNWFRVEVRGAENIPTDGSALLVSNHAGAMPIDGLVLHSVVYDAVQRHPRMLGADLVFTTAVSHDFARRIGTTVACREDAARLLESNQLVSVFPEGFKGLGKLYSERYRLQRFGRGGFVSTAIEAQVPIVPVSIVGSEEIFPLMANLPSLARTLGFPYFPVTPLFPWFGLLGMIPLPSKWIIDFSEPVTTDELPTGAAEDPMTVFQITDQVRITIQNRLYTLLEERPNPFF